VFSTFIFEGFPNTAALYEQRPLAVSLVEYIDLEVVEEGPLYVGFRELFNKLL